MLEALYTVADEQLPEFILASARLGERMFLVSGALEASIMNVERAQGALLAQETEFAQVRFSDARGNALLAADLIRAAADSCFQCAFYLPESPMEIQQESAWAGKYFRQNVESSPVTLQIVRRAGIEPDLLDILIPDEDPSESLAIFKSALRTVGGRAMAFAGALDDWGSEPPPAELARLRDHPPRGGAGIAASWTTFGEDDEETMESEAWVEEATEDA